MNASESTQFSRIIDAKQPRHAGICSPLVVAGDVKGWVISGSKSDSRAERMNAWNLGKRFTKAYTDGKGDPAIEMDVNLAGGVTRRNLEETFSLWTFSMGKFKESLSQ